MKNKRVLIFAAHPDDEVLGVGGTIARLKDLGNKIFVCFVTEGSSTQYKNNSAIQKRKFADCEKAMKVLGVDKTIFLNFKDMQLDQVPHYQLNESICGVIDAIKPELIFSTSPYDLNKDHQLVAESVKVAVRRITQNYLGKIYFYEILSSSEWNFSNQFLPNKFIDISKYMEEKKKAFSCYRTEIREYPHPRSFEGIDILARYRGLQVGFEFAEAFMLYREIF